MAYCRPAQSRPRCDGPHQNRRHDAIRHAAQGPAEDGRALAALRGRSRSAVQHASATGFVRRPGFLLARPNRRPCRAASGFGPAAGGQGAGGLHPRTWLSEDAQKAIILDLDVTNLEFSIRKTRVGSTVDPLSIWIVRPEKHSESR